MLIGIIIFIELFPDVIRTGPDDAPFIAAYFDILADRIRCRYSVNPI